MSLFPKPFQVIRTPQTLVRGIWTDGTPSTLTFKGTVQPLSGQDLMTLEPASRDIGKVWVRTKSPLIKRQEGETTKADVVLWNGFKWEVIDDRQYSNGLIPHHKYLAEYRGPA